MVKSLIYKFTYT